MYIRKYRQNSHTNPEYEHPVHLVLTLKGGGNKDVNLNEENLKEKSKEENLKERKSKRRKNIEEINIFYKNIFYKFI